MALTPQEQQELELLEKERKNYLDSNPNGFKKNESIVTSKLTPEEEKELAQLEKERELNFQIELDEKAARQKRLSDIPESPPGTIAKILKEQARYEDIYNQTPTKPPSKLDSLMRGFTQGGTFGYGDEVSGGMEVLKKYLTQKFKGDKTPIDFRDDYVKNRDFHRLQLERAKKENPKSYLAGELLGGGATMAVPGLQEATVAKLTALGALQGLGYSNASLSEKPLESTKDIAAGTVLGAAAGGLGKAIQSLLSTKAMSRLAQNKALKALGYSKPLLRTQERRNAAQKVGQEMLNQEVITPWASAGKMNERVQNVLERSGTEIGEFLRNQGLSYPTKSAIDAIENLRPRDSSGTLLQKGTYGKINSIIDGYLETIKSHKENIPFEEANRLKGLLQGITNWDSDKIESELGKKVSGIMRKSIDDALEDSTKNYRTVYSTTESNAPKSSVNSSPNFGTDLQNIPQQSEGALESFSNLPSVPKNYEGKSGFDFENVTDTKPEVIPGIDEEKLRQYKNFLKNKQIYKSSLEAQDALNNRISSEMGNKSFGITDTILAGSGLTSSLLGNRPIYGMTAAAVIAAKKMAERYANPIIASNANQIVKILETHPEVLGKYAPVLIDSSRRGTQALITNHFLLTNNDPEYRVLMRDLMNDISSRAQQSTNQ